jgi:hypothetical protein
LVKRSKRGGGFVVGGDGRGIEGRAGLALAVEVADRIGLTDALSRALGGVRSWRDHDPGVVVRDLAVMLIDGGKAVDHLAPRHPELFGRTASQPTAWRTIEAIAADELAVTRISAALSQVRGWTWGLPGGGPPVLEPDCDEPVCIDLDATLVTAHSDKDGAAGTYKGGYGFAPNLAFLDRGDGTGEALAGILRSGNANANTAADNIDLLETALQTVPELPEGKTLVARGDTALATKDFLGYARQAGCRFSVSFELTEAIKTAIRALDDDAWQPAVRQNGDIREGAAVAELTDRVTLPEGWPDGARLLVRREPRHPGAQLTFDDIDGARFTALLTDQDGDVVTLERRHRARARCEDRIRVLKTLGLRNLPCGDFERNQTWLQLTLLALNLCTWTQTLTLDGDLARAEPARLRYQLFHVAARITRRARRLRVAFQADWPWTNALLAAFARLRALPLPAT